MSHSLRAKLSKLRYKGLIEDKDYKRLCHALDLEKEEQVKKNCDTCTYSDEKDSGECYECVKGIQDWYEKSWECKGLYADGVDYSGGEENEPYICDSCKHKDDLWDTEPCDGCCGNHSGYEPCEDAISRRAVKEALRNRTGESISECINAIPSVRPQEPKFIVKPDGTIEQIKNCDECLFKKEWEKIGKLLSVVLEKQTEQEPKTGHWTHDGSHWKNRFICSECGGIILSCEIDLPKYCGYCGAEMKGEDDG